MGITASSAPAHGTTVLTENIIVYTPADEFTGTDTFTYTVADGATSTGQVTIEVMAPDEA